MQVVRVFMDKAEVESYQNSHDLKTLVELQQFSDDYDNDWAMEEYFKRIKGNAREFDIAIKKNR